MSTVTSAAPTPHHENIAAQFAGVRRQSLALCEPLTPEDMMVQSIAEASPAKWHLAHTTWFFETFILREFLPGYKPFHPDFLWLFNSYYNGVSAQPEKQLRATFSRPSLAEILDYRRHVESAMESLLAEGLPSEAETRLILGLHHEQQHQELLITDITHAFAQNPLAPAAMPFWREAAPFAGPAQFIAFPGGDVTIGHEGDGFHFDNETPRHTLRLAPYELADRLVSNRDWLEFMGDDGYRRVELWMSDGWDTVCREGWRAPFYWRERDGAWSEFGPSGLAPLDLEAPVRHVSWYEADAYARWAGARLPEEAEWEASAGDDRLHEMHGRVWQWTGSAYRPYPGFRPVEGAIGEYNGKFMINQMVLRGSSAATSPGHARDSYRNFFQPEKRWQVTGLRLARDL